MEILDAARCRRRGAQAPPRRCRSTSSPGARRSAAWRSAGSIFARAIPRPARVHPSRGRTAPRTCSSRSCCGTRRNSPQPRIVRAAECVGIEQRDACVEARVRRDDGSEQRVEAEWVVAADGAGSPVRRMLGIPMEGHGPARALLHGALRGRPAAVDAAPLGPDLLHPEPGIAGLPDRPRPEALARLHAAEPGLRGGRAERSRSGWRRRSVCRSRRRFSRSTPGRRTCRWRRATARDASSWSATRRTASRRPVGSASTPGSRRRTTWRCTVGGGRGRGRRGSAARRLRGRLPPGRSRQRRRELREPEAPRRDLARDRRVAATSQRSSAASRRSRRRSASSSRRRSRRSAATSSRMVAYPANTAEASLARREGLRRARYRRSGPQSLKNGLSPGRPSSTRPAVSFHWGDTMMCSGDDAHVAQAAIERTAGEVRRGPRGGVQQLDGVDRRQARLGTGEVHVHALLGAGLMARLDLPPHLLDGLERVGPRRPQAGDRLGIHEMDRDLLPQQLARSAWLPLGGQRLEVLEGRTPRGSRSTARSRGRDPSGADTPGRRRRSASRRRPSRSRRAAAGLRRMRARRAPGGRMNCS